ncbi:efflux RND transporter permease subunit, partial [Acinetobacter baumannii]
IVQADANRRLQPEDLTSLYARNSNGGMVPFSAFVTAKWINGPVQLIRYNGYPAMKIAGGAAPGRSTGEAMAEMESYVAKLPPGFGFEWTGQS